MSQLSTTSVRWCNVRSESGGQVRAQLRVKHLQVCYWCGGGALGLHQPWIDAAVEEGEGCSSLTSDQQWEYTAAAASTPALPQARLARSGAGWRGEAATWAAAGAGGGQRLLHVQCVRAGLAGLAGGEAGARPPARPWLASSGRAGAGGGAAAARWQHTWASAVTTDWAAVVQHRGAWQRGGVAPASGRSRPDGGDLAAAATRHVWRGRQQQYCGDSVTLVTSAIHYITRMYSTQI